MRVQPAAFEENVDTRREAMRRARCRASSEDIGQSKPDAGLGIQIKALKFL